MADLTSYQGLMVALYPAICSIERLGQLLQKEVGAEFDLQVVATEPRQKVVVRWNELGRSWRILDCVYFENFYMEGSDWLRLLSDPMLSYIGEERLSLLRRYVNEDKERGVFLTLTGSLDAILSFLSMMEERDKWKLVVNEPRAAVQSATYRVAGWSSWPDSEWVENEADFVIEQDGARNEHEAREYIANGLAAYYCHIACREEWMAHRLTSTSESSGYGQVFKGPFIEKGRWLVLIYEELEQAVKFLGVVFNLKKVG